jgi:hypothetical protein
MPGICLTDGPVFFFSAGIEKGLSRTDFTGGAMRNKTKYYIAFLRIELEDLQEDLELLIARCESNFKEERITERVFRENVALFRNELMGLNDFARIVDQTDPSEFENLDELIRHLREVFVDLIRTRDLAQALKVCVDRKLAKVARYMDK